MDKILVNGGGLGNDKVNVRTKTGGFYWELGSISLLVSETRESPTHIDRTSYFFHSKFRAGLITIMQCKDTQICFFNSKSLL